MKNTKDILQVLFLILIITISVCVLAYFQHKSNLNAAKHPMKPLTVEEKLRFKSGLSN